MRWLANTFIFDVHDAIETVPGTTAARRTLVATALRYMDGLAAEQSDDPTLPRELAEGFLKIGDVLGNPGASNLVDQPGKPRGRSLLIWTIVGAAFLTPCLDGELRASFESRASLAGGKSPRRIFDSVLCARS